MFSLKIRFIREFFKRDYFEAGDCGQLKDVHSQMILYSASIQFVSTFTLVLV